MTIQNSTVKSEAAHRARCQQNLRARQSTSVHCDAGKLLFKAWLFCSFSHSLHIPFFFSEKPECKAPCYINHKCQCECETTPCKKIACESRTSKSKCDWYRRKYGVSSGGGGDFVAYFSFGSLPRLLSINKILAGPQQETPFLQEIKSFIYVSSFCQKQN